MATIDGTKAEILSQFDSACAHTLMWANSAGMAEGTMRTWFDVLAYRVVDWTRGRLDTELPAPSLLVDRRIYCFAPPDPNGRWAYFDLAERTGSHDFGPSSPLRSVRSPGDGHMTSRTILTPHGLARAERVLLET